MERLLEEEKNKYHYKSPSTLSLKSHVTVQQ